MTPVDKVDNSDVDTLFLVLCTVLAMFSQVGLSMVEIGAVQAKSCQFILIKNLFNLCVVVFWWYLFGYTIATGPHDSGHFLGSAKSHYLGESYVAMEGLDDGAPMVPPMSNHLYSVSAGASE